MNLLRTLRAHSDWIGRITWSPDGRILASPSADQTIRLWDVESGQLLATLRGHLDIVWSAAFSPDGGTLASVSGDRTARTWDPVTGKPIHTLEGHQGSVRSVAFAPGGRALATGSEDRTVRLWETVTGHLLRTLEGHQGSVRSVAFAPDGRALATGSEDRTVRLWETATGRLLRSMEGHAGGFWSVAFAPDGSTLASASDDRTVKIWDFATGQPLRRLEGHTESTTCVAFSPDGHMIASTGTEPESAIRLWRADTGACIAMMEEPTIGPWPPGLAFHPTAWRLATAGVDAAAPNEEEERVIHLWDLDPDILLSRVVVPNVTYTNAKIVLLGESNVGKSCLAMRLAENRYPKDHEQGTTHGMKFWSLEPEQLSPAEAAPPGHRRDVVLWDMGGQEEYRLIHQLFLEDATVALVMLDPTRGAHEFEKVETWNKYLDKQLRGRPVVKLLVGAKQDLPSSVVNRQALERLVAKCGFEGYQETSALTGRGIPELQHALAEAIDWTSLPRTTRPVLFQRIRDVIEDKRRRGDVVLHLYDLSRSLSNKPLKEEEARAVDAVTAQLATQGVIARSSVATGETVLVLQVQEIERYAGSLIIAARNNPRGVPALELRAIAQPEVVLPGIATKDRLPRQQEMVVLECTVQLLLEHGICFQHEGLLIFPSLFATAAGVSPDERLPHSISLFYDFSGAIDNIYASLVARLVLAGKFGKVRLLGDRAEFEVGDTGLCGLRQVTRPGGFARMDIYFEEKTGREARNLFAGFVEDHLRQHGVELHERVAVTCSCGKIIDEETVRQRIARGHTDVVCPVCETRHSLSEGAGVARESDRQIDRGTWALRTEIEQRHRESAKEAVALLNRAALVEPVDAPIRLLHLSGLRFRPDSPVEARLRWLADDLRRGEGLGFDRLDHLVISGDFTDRGDPEGFERAYEFVSALAQQFGLSAQRCIFVPGNHDIADLRDAYRWEETINGLKDDEWIKQGDIYLVRDPKRYPLRFKGFWDRFYHLFFQQPYPEDYIAQGLAIPFWETGLQFLALNSCWQIDQFHRKRAGVHPGAIAHALAEATKQEAYARKAGQVKRPMLRIAVWHHAVTGPDMMLRSDFVEDLQECGVKIALHGDIVEQRSDLVAQHWRGQRKLHLIASGCLSGPQNERTGSVPRLYNLLEIARDHQSIRVHTRHQPDPDGPWKGWQIWPSPEGGTRRAAYYDII